MSTQQTQFQPVTGTPATIGPDDWTQSNVTKRELDPGETRTLEIKTTAKGDRNGRFEVSLVFAEGCEVQVTIEGQQVVSTP